MEKKKTDDNMGFYLFIECGQSLCKGECPMSKRLWQTEREKILYVSVLLSQLFKTKSCFLYSWIYPSTM